MIFEWDDSKEQINIIKHGIDFSTAAHVFHDENRIEFYDEAHSEYEDRYITIGQINGIAIIVSPENPVSDLDVETIAKIYTGEITNWKDLGGSDAEIVLIGREAGSGTRDGFESITGTKDACKYRQELTSTGDVITTVSQNPDAIGYASLAAVSDKVKTLTVGGVTPTEDTVKDGSYVIQRPFVLVTKTGETLSPAAQAFFDYATSVAANDLIKTAGAVAVAK